MITEYKTRRKYEKKLTYNQNFNTDDEFKWVCFVDKPLIVINKNQIIEQINRQVTELLPEITLLNQKLTDIFTIENKGENKTFGALIRKIGEKQLLNLKDKNNLKFKCEIHKYNQHYLCFIRKKEALIADIEELGVQTKKSLLKNKHTDNKELFKQLIIKSLNGIILTDEHGVITEWNEGQQLLTGIKSEDVTGKYIWDVNYNLMPPESKKEISLVFLKKTVLQYLKSEKEFESAKPRQRKILCYDNKIKTVLTSTFLIKTSKGKIFASVFRDMTDLSLMQEELENQRDFLDLIINTIPNPIFYKNRKGIFVGCNNAFAEFNGKTKEEIIGKSAFDIVPKEQAEIFQKADNDIFNNGGIQIFESKAIDAQGEIRNVINYKQVFRTSGYEGVVGVLLDITKHKKYEHELKKLSTAIDSSIVAVVITDKDANIEYVNKKFTDITGYSSDEVLGRNPRIWQSASQTKEKYETLWKTILSGDTWTGEFENVKKDGTKYYEKAIISPVFDNHNQITHFVSIKEDITAKKIADKALQESEHNFRTMINNLGDAVFVTDIYGQIIDLNITAERQLEYTRDELLRMKIIDLNSDETKHIFSEVADEIRKNGKASFETIHKTKHGKLVPTEVKSTIAEMQGEKTVLSLARDITERKNAEKTLRKSALELRELNATKDKLFSIISHDLKNPFNTIIGFLSFLIVNFEVLSPEKILKHLNTTFIATKLGYNLLENLLDWSRMHAGAIKYTPTKIDVSEVIDDCIILLKSTAQTKNIKIVYSQNESLVAYADKNMISTVIRNLLTNAIKFSDNNTEIVISAKQKENFMRISVKDSGVGISEEGRKHLFKIEKNYTTKGTAKESGTGLGLIICKEFIEMNKGELFIESKPDEGSTFSFTIPIYENG